MSSVPSTFPTSFATLIRREFWEHRPLWVTPLAVSACIILMTIVAAAQFAGADTGGAGVRFQPSRAFDPSMFLSTGLAIVIMLQHLIISIVIIFYLLDCLYAERKDRSILFWKSLPVSDTNTVLSKFVVASVIVPTGVFVLSGITSVVAAGILYVSFSSLASQLWDASAWARMYGVFFVGLVTGLFWYAPIVAYLMLVSAWARRSVLLWAILPPVAALLIEGYAFDTNYVGTFLRTRLGAPPTLAGPIGGVPSHIPTVDFAAFGSLQMWLGVVAAALLLFCAIRIRRYRDDT
jgi:ABC-2 type transport system permease protein